MKSFVCLRSIFRRDIDDARHYDMVLNTDRISCEQCVDIILEAMARLGLHSPLPVA